MNNFDAVFNAIKEECPNADIPSETCYSRLCSALQDNKSYVSIATVFGGLARSWTSHVLQGDEEHHTDGERQAHWLFIRLARTCGIINTNVSCLIGKRLYNE